MDALLSIMLRVTPEAPEDAARLSEMIADGLTRYLIYADRPDGHQEADVGLMIESLEFWAGVHGYSKTAQDVGLVASTSPARKPVQNQNGPGLRYMTVAAGK